MRVFCTLIALTLFACGDPAEPSVGSNSNWLKACVGVKECGGDAFACVCSACSQLCRSDDDCKELPGAHCATANDPAATASCGPQSISLCLPACEPGGCAEDQACVAGSCVLAALPGADLCADVQLRDQADRKREDELLAALAALRSQGGATCGSAAASMPAPPVRLDPRLICNARVLALDIATHGVSGLTDSQGRSTPDRLSAVGYDQSQWGESFAIDARNADAALQYMLADVDTCTRLADPRFHDVGVGVAGTTWVITIASE